MAGALLLICTLTAKAQNTDTERIIREKDSLFWVAYNNCSYEGMREFIADDVEFYHDKGGVQKGWETFEQTTKKNLCGRENWRLRREAVAGSYAIYPMEDNGKLYGALLSGDHKFYVTENGKPEYWSGVAKFTHLWLLDNGHWKMSRILSYDHQPPPYVNTRKEIAVPASILKKYRGTYNSKLGAIAVTPKKNSLLLTIGAKSYTVFPEKENLFFSKERNLTFEFVPAPEKAAMLVIRESGSVVEKVPLLK